MTKLRGFFVGGNWKMNTTKSSAGNIISTLNSSSIPQNTVVVISPPFVYLDYVRSNLNKNFELAAQNCHESQTGAYTGEISSLMIKDLNCNWVILGHSERRTLFGETDELIGKKLTTALGVGLGVIACVGETLEERENGKTENVISRQINAIKNNVKNWENVVIAYEPVWAIGTGKVATTSQVAEVHKFIRTLLVGDVRIIYGGSVNVKNCQELGRLEDVDGFLVGVVSRRVGIEGAFPRRMDRVIHLHPPSFSRFLPLLRSEEANLPDEVHG